MASDSAEDQNLNEVRIRKVVKCHDHNLTYGILSITLCDRYTWH
jgi:hypothetical protein